MLILSLLGSDIVFKVFQLTISDVSISDILLYLLLFNKHSSTDSLTVLTSRSNRLTKVQPGKEKVLAIVSNYDTVS